MNWRTLLTSPLPQDVLVLDGDTLACGRLDRRRERFVQVEEAALPPGWVTLGPVGALQVDREALGSALGSILARFQKRPQRVSVVVPNAWVRSVVVDVGVIPRQRQEAEDVIRWRLKKLLPCRPEDVRLDYLPTGENGWAIVVLGLERPFAVVEEVSAAAGLRVGNIAPSAVTLTTLLPDGESTQLLALVEDTALAIVAATKGELRMLRAKGLPASSSMRSTLVQRELGQTLEHCRSFGAEAVELFLAGSDAEEVERIGEWALERTDVHVRAFPAGGVAGATVVAGHELRAFMLLAAARARVS